jgi:DNA-binding FadR family transcriptional regulator
MRFACLCDDEEQFCPRHDLRKIIVEVATKHLVDDKHGKRVYLDDCAWTDIEEAVWSLLAAQEKAHHEAINLVRKTEREMMLVAVKKLKAEHQSLLERARSEMEALKKGQMPKGEKKKNGTLAERLGFKQEDVEFCTGVDAAIAEFDTIVGKKEVL